MAQNDLIKRLLDAGLQFTQMTQRRAEELVADLVKAGEVQAEQAQTFVTEVYDRSRKNSEEFVDRVRAEVRNQVAALDLVTRDTLNRLEFHFFHAALGQITRLPRLHECLDIEISRTGPGLAGAWRPRPCADR